jgi:uncharacterized Zn-finger protein
MAATPGSKHSDTSFAQQSSLTEPLRVHSREKHFMCTHCDFRFYTKAELTRHLRVHGDEKPFVCEHCDFRCKIKEDKWQPGGELAGAQWRETVCLRALRHSIH